MKKSFPYLGFASCALMILATGCMDDKYDLSDIDTTTRISVNDLVIPINLESVKLDDVIELGDDENVKVVTDANGNKVYAIWQDGDINSDPITIKEIHISPEEIDDSHVGVNKVGNGSAGSASVRYAMDKMSSVFAFRSSDVDESVKSVSDLRTVNPAELEVKLVIPSSIAVSKVELENVEIIFPKNLYFDGQPAKSNIGTYNPQTGIVTIASHTATSNIVPVTLQANDFRFADGELSINTTTRELLYTGLMGTTDNGHLTITSSGATPPANFDLAAQYDQSAFYVKNFSGEILYDVENTDIEPIDLDDLPDFLQDRNTNVILSNPQIYIGALNSTADYHAECSASILLDSEFYSGATNQSSSPTFIIGYDKGVTTYNVALSPEGTALKPIEEYSNNLTKYSYPELKNMLSAGETADGLPHIINLTLDNPHFFGNVINFPVEAPGVPTSDYEIQGLKAYYTFYAPLAFDAETNIIYNKVNNNWNSEELEYLEVTKMQIEADAVSSIPAEVALTIYPIDKDEKHLGRANQLLLPAFASEKVVLTIEAESEDKPIRNIHGLDYRAIVRQLTEGAGESLSPDQTLELKNIRIKASGYYTKEF